jgi:hypothetical protein
MKSTPSTQGPVRLTRRGRLALTLSFIALAAGLVTAAGQGAGASDDPMVSATDIYVVKPGQSLWAIAHAVSPGTDPRETVARIMDLNGMGSASVSAGRALVVPG